MYNMWLSEKAGLKILWTDLSLLFKKSYVCEKLNLSGGIIGDFDFLVTYLYSLDLPQQICIIIINVILLEHILSKS